MSTFSTVTCPHCRGAITNDPALAGKVVQCPHCQRQLTMPQLPSFAASQGSGDPFDFVSQDKSPPHQSLRPAASKPKPRGRKEIRATCNACGNVWHYLPGERMGELGQGMNKLGCNIMTCGCLLPFIGSKRNSTLTTRCPKCSSSSISRQTVVH